MLFKQIQAENCILIVLQVRNQCPNKIQISVANFLSFIYLILAATGSSLLVMNFSLVVASRAYSQVVVSGLLFAVVSLVAEHGL